MNNFIWGALAIAITASLPILAMILVIRKLRKAPTTNHYLSILNNTSASAEQHADAFCSLINADYVCSMTKINNGGKYNDHKHTERFVRSVNPQRLSKINNIVDKINSERVITYEYN